tara:strand:+ start:1585 stop:1731 length:147 start_codon:yes stop_codon:yes gene_type:complete
MSVHKDRLESASLEANQEAIDESNWNVFSTLLNYIWSKDYYEGEEFYD